MAVERASCAAVAHDASRPFPRWSTCPDWPAGYAWLPQIGLQAGYLVVRGMRLLGFFGSAKLEQPLYGPSHEGSEGRSGSFGQGAHVAISALLKGASMRFWVWDPHGNRGRRPKNRAVGVSARTRIPSSKRDKNEGQTRFFGLLWPQTRVCRFIFGFVLLSACWFHGLYRGDSPTQSGVTSETREEATVRTAGESQHITDLASLER